MKVVINTCYGGFGLSDKALEALGKEEYEVNFEMERHDPALVQIVEALGEGARISHADLTVVEIPDYADYTISDYDGLETLRWFLSREEKLRRIQEACPQLSTEDAMNLVKSLWEGGVE